MTKTATRRRKVEMPSGIRKKFTAALSMLLVAALMVVGSTYAWFTLSTAPEVKGITTSIGANGNLEIALLNATSFQSTADDLGIESAVGDSMENTTNNWTVAQANEKWGNLVDLSTGYGLSSITLMPAALNYDMTDSVVNDTSILQVALYGNDGRVISVNQDTVSSLYQNNAFTQLGTTMAGVRGIGVSTGVSLRQLNYRAAMNAANDALSSARTKLNTSLTTRGEQLGQLLVKVANAGSSTTFQAADIAVINNIITDITAANADVLTGIRQATLAYVLSAANTSPTALDDDTKVAAATTAFSTVAISDIATLAATYGVAALPSQITDAIAQYNTTQSHIENANQKYAAVQTPCTLDDNNEALKNAIDAVVTRSNITVNNIVPVNVSEADKTTLKNQIINSQVANIVMGANSGLYSDIAKSTGNTSASVPMTVSYDGVDVHVTANFTVTPGTPYVLVVAINNSNSAGAYTGGTGTAFAVTPYGYALDFGFRTNASNANLLLQADAAQRVYEDSQNANTQGAGSFFEFSIGEGFTKDKVILLMGALRVVFVTPTADGYEILAVATAGTAQDVTEEVNNVSTVVGVKAPLVLHEYSFTAAQQGEAPILAIGDPKLDANDDPDYTITALTKNVAKKVTAIVYLDGDRVDNTMVANAAQSMSGKLNLQFATDVELVPMENAALHGNTNNGGNTQTTNFTKEQLSAGMQAIAASQIYQAAEAAGTNGTDEQQALVLEYSNAETVRDNDSATQQQINGAVLSLGSAYASAGGTNPFVTNNP